MAPGHFVRWALCKLIEALTPRTDLDFLGARHRGARANLKVETGGQVGEVVLTGFNLGDLGGAIAVGDSAAFESSLDGLT